MIALLVLQTVVIALLGVLVLGLLRSHAEILRRLHALDGGADEPDFRVDPALPAPGHRTADARAVHDVSGVTPSGDALALRVAGVAHRTLLVFLSSGCSTCAAFWSAFSDGDEAALGLPEGTRLVVVAKDEHEESISRLARLAPQDHPVVLSSEAWQEYGVPGSPYVVFADGPSGRVLGEGAAQDWPQVAGLLSEADRDRRRATRRHGGRGRAHDADRADRIDAELAAAGITPGDPSLYSGAGEQREERA